MPLLAALLLFLLISARYAASLELWGDEAFSLVCAAKEWHQLFPPCDAHLPTYYLLQLGPLIRLFSIQSDFVLRILHALVFCVGLVFCWLIARDQLRSRALLWALLMSTILLPNYIFYATNIRMYSLLFSCSMAFAWASFRLLSPPPGSARPKALYLLTGLITSLIDYPGIAFFVLTTTFLIALRRVGKLARKTWLLLAASGIVLTALAGVVLKDGLQAFMQWPTFTSMALGGDLLRSALKLGFFLVRPFLDLVYPPASPLALNIYLWAVIVVALLWSFADLIRQGRRSDLLVCFFACYWLMFSPFGLAFTRAFLPAQFFALLAVFLSLERVLSARKRLIAGFLIVSLLSIGVFNAHQAMFPSLRLYSRIPYRQIASDAVAVARERNIGVIALSRHTLNALSIERSLRTQRHPTTDLLVLDHKPSCESFPAGRFLYIHLMPEDGEDSDPVDKCRGLRMVRYTPIKNYVNFKSLGYNKLWAGSLADKAGMSESAARLAEVDVH